MWVAFFGVARNRGLPNKGGPGEAMRKSSIIIRMKTKKSTYNRVGRRKNAAPKARAATGGFRYLALRS